MKEPSEEKDEISQYGEDVECLRKNDIFDNKDIIPLKCVGIPISNFSLCLEMEFNNLGTGILTGFDLKYAPDSSEQDLTFRTHYIKKDFLNESSCWAIQIQEDLYLFLSQYHDSEKEKGTRMIKPMLYFKEKELVVVSNSVKLKLKYFGSEGYWFFLDNETTILEVFDKEERIYIDIDSYAYKSKYITNKPILEDSGESMAESDSELEPEKTSIPLIVSKKISPPVLLVNKDNEINEKGKEEEEYSSSSSTEESNSDEDDVDEDHSRFRRYYSDEDDVDEDHSRIRRYYSDEDDVDEDHSRIRIYYPNGDGEYRSKIYYCPYFMEESKTDEEKESESFHELKEDISSNIHKSRQLAIKTVLNSFSLENEEDSIPDLLKDEDDVDVDEDHSKFKFGYPRSYAYGGSRHGYPDYSDLISRHKFRESDFSKLYPSVMITDNTPPEKPPKPICEKGDDDFILSDRNNTLIPELLNSQIIQEILSSKEFTKDKWNHFAVKSIHKYKNVKLLISICDNIYCIYKNEIDKTDFFGDEFINLVETHLTNTVNLLDTYLNRGSFFNAIDTFSFKICLEILRKIVVLFHTKAVISRNTTNNEESFQTYVKFLEILRLREQKINLVEAKFYNLKVVEEQKKVELILEELKFKIQHKSNKKWVKYALKKYKKLAKRCFFQSPTSFYIIKMREFLSLIFKRYETLTLKQKKNLQPIISCLSQK